MEKLAEGKVGAILDLAIEADLDALDVSGIAAQKQTQLMVDSLKDCIDIASHQPESFIAVKVTALAPPNLLLSWSLTLQKLRAAFTEIAGGNDEINEKQFLDLINYFPNLKSLAMKDIFKKHDLNSSGTFTFSDVSAVFSLFNTKYCRALIGNEKGTASGIRWLTDTDLDTAELIIPEIRKLCEYAGHKKVKLMMDAEQTYLQPAIDDIVIGLCRLYNPKVNSTGWKEPLVYNTYQLYLTDALGRLKTDLLRSEQKGYSFGVKLVRGAYMVAERARAIELNYPSPIHPSIEATHSAYDAGVKHVIESQAKYPRTADSPCPVSMVVASHNHASIDTTCKLMEQYGIPRSGGWVSFGQLLGMQDGKTQQLASNGFKALKYVPYGPVPVVVAYLHRRAQENSQMVNSMDLDRLAILKELKTRLIG
jgi:hypothetical protein